MIGMTVVIILYFRFCRIRKLRATKGSHNNVAPGTHSHSNEHSSTAGGTTFSNAERSSRKVALGASNAATVVASP